MTGTQITLADLSITGGDASRMQVSQSASGGGVFVTGASLTISNSLVYANIIGPIAGSYSYGYGGGIYAATASLRILNSQVYNNLANVNSSGYGHGGGLYARTACWKSPKVKSTAIPPPPAPQAQLVMAAASSSTAEIRT
jgi:hypothetical protein